MDNVIVELDEQGIRNLVAKLSMRRAYLDHGVPLPDYDSIDHLDPRGPFIMWVFEEQLRMNHPYYQTINPYLNAMNGPIVLTLTMDKVTAKELLITIYELGEHYAAGAEVARGSSDVEALLNAVLGQLTAYFDETR